MTGWHGITLETGLFVSVIILATCLWYCLRGLHSCPIRLRYGLTLLRMLSMVLLCLILFNPGRWTHPSLSENGWWAVLLDNSASMQTTDVQRRSRWSAATELIQKAHERCQHPEQMKVYTFSEQLNPVTVSALPSLNPDGSQTLVNKAVQELLQRPQGRLKGIVLLSDGHSTGDPLDNRIAGLAQANSIPVYAVPLGGKVELPDLSLAVQQTHRVAFLNQAHPVTVECTSRHLPPMQAQLTAADAQQNILTNITVAIPADSSVPVEIRLTPDLPGFEQIQLSLTPHPNEKRITNNRQMIGISTITNALRVLLAEGSPCWDSKFLARFLRQQSFIDVTALYQIAPGQVLTLTPKSDKPLQASHLDFPDNVQALSYYDLVLLGKNCGTFLDEKRTQALKATVREQGLGVICSRGKPYQGSQPEFAETEPVVWGPAINRSLRFAPVADQSPFGDTLPPPDAPIWSSFPLLDGAHAITDVKPFAHVLAEDGLHQGLKQPTPILIYRRYGRGMVLSLNAEGLWHWDFFPENMQSRNIYRDVWTQLILWSATHSDFLPGRDYAVELSATIADMGDTISAAVQSRAPTADAFEPTLNVYTNGRLIDAIVLTPDPRNSERWNGIYTPRKPGFYYVQLSDKANRFPPGIGQFLQVRPPRSEQDCLDAQPERLQAFCEATGGQLIQPDQWEALVQQLDEPESETTQAKAVWTPIWDKAPLLLLLLITLSAEWFLRRRNGLL